MLKQLQVARGSEVASGISEEDFQNYGLSFIFFYIVKNATNAYQLKHFGGKYCYNSNSKPSFLLFILEEEEKNRLKYLFL